MIAVSRRTNLCPNPSAEVDISSWGARWFGSGGNGTRTQNIGTGIGGGNSYRKTWTVAGASADTGSSFTFPVNPGDVFSMSANMKPSINSTFQCWITFHGYDGTVLNPTSPPVGDSVSAPAGQYTFNKKENVVAPAAAAYADFIFGPYNGAPTMNPGDYLDFDQVIIEKAATVGPYFDGNTSTTSDYVYAWSGASGITTSYESAPSFRTVGGPAPQAAGPVSPGPLWTRVPGGTWVKGQTVQARKNLFLNPSAELGISNIGVNNPGNTHTFLSTAGSPGAWAGTKMARLTLTGTPTTKNIGGYFISQVGGEIVGGQNYVGSMWLRMSRANIVFGRLEWKDSGGGALGTSASRLFYVQANTWVQIWQTGLSSTGTAKIIFTCYGDTTGVLCATNDTWDFDAGLVEVGTALGSYFDGTTTGPDYVYSWTGTAHGSASIATP